MTVGLLLLWGCTDGEAPSTPSALDAGWHAQLLDNPGQFATTIEADRAGWVQYHSNDLAGALAGGGLPAQRAAEDLAIVYSDLAWLAGRVWEKTFTTWASRSGLPAQSAIPVIAALAALEAGEADRAAAWLDRGGAYASPEVEALAQRLSGGLEAVSAEDGALSACIAAHVAARSTGGTVSVCPDGPLIREQADGHTRALYSPLPFATRAAQHAAHDSPPTSGLPGLLFSGTLFAVVFACTVRFLTIPIQGLDAGLQNLSPNLDNAARSLGTASLPMLRRVHLPLLRVPLATSALLVFVDTLKELPAALVLRPFNTNTLAVRAFELASDERLADAALPALTILLAGVAPVILLTRSIRNPHQESPHADH